MNSQINKNIRNNNRYKEMNENNGLHVILDIDGTLIDNTRINNNILSNNHDGISCGHFIYFRPYLIPFLEYCVKCCASVSIWTAGNEDWMKGFILSLPLDFHNAFLFTWHRNKCNIRYKNMGCEATEFFKMNDLVMRKPLRKIWKTKWAQKKGMTKHNTVIIEDSPENCCKNYGNAIYVPEYNYLLNKQDDTLLKLQLYLNQLSTKKSVRHIEKRQWLVDIKLKEQQQERKETDK